MSGVALFCSLFLGLQLPAHINKISQKFQTVISLFPACTSATLLRRWKSTGSLNAHAGKGVCNTDAAAPISVLWWSGCISEGFWTRLAGTPREPPSPPALGNSLLMQDPHGTAGREGRDRGRTRQDILLISLSPWWGDFPSHPLRQFNLMGISTGGFTHGHKRAAPWGTPVPAVHPQVIRPAELGHGWVTLQRGLPHSCQIR